MPVDETAAIRPESVYAETKAMVERILHWYGETRGLRAVSLRYFNAAGASFDGRIGEDWYLQRQPRPARDEGRAPRRPQAERVRRRLRTPDGTCIRDYIHVDDLADAHVKALDYLARGGATVEVNVGTGLARRCSR